VSDSILVAESLSAGYSRGALILHDISLSLRKRRVLAVIGPNGAGKTTLFKALSGELPLARGKVSLYMEGRRSEKRSDIHALSPRKRALHVARVLQNEHAAWPVPVADYVEAGLFARQGWFGADHKASIHSSVDAALARLGIGELAQRLVTELSGGEFRRVVIARALVQNPDILLMDEPTADLDMAHQLETIQLMRELAAAGKAVAFSVHDLNQAAMAADDILLLERGRIVAGGSPAEVLTPAMIDRTYGTRVIVQTHPRGGVPHIILDPPWLSRHPAPDFEGDAP
jgi:iron complex transport system ATP-binding protein